MMKLLGVWVEVTTLVIPGLNDSAAELSYVYVGNVSGETGGNTCCCGCGVAVIQRSGMGLVQNRRQKDLCPECSKTIDGVVL